MLKGKDGPCSPYPCLFMDILAFGTPGLYFGMWENY